MQAEAFKNEGESPPLVTPTNVASAWFNSTAVVDEGCTLAVRLGPFPKCFGTSRVLPCPGNEAFKTGKWKEAIEGYTKAIDIDPDNKVQRSR